MTKVILVTFNTSAEALLFKRQCQADGINTRITPAARLISVSCGFACEIEEKDIDKAKRAASKKSISYKIYRIINNKASMIG